MKLSSASPRVGAYEGSNYCGATLDLQNPQPQKSPRSSVSPCKTQKPTQKQIEAVISAAISAAEQAAACAVVAALKATNLRLSAVPVPKALPVTKVMYPGSYCLTL